MYVGYGTPGSADYYQHQDGEASVVFRVQSLYSRWRGFRYAVRYSMIIQGELSCNHPSKSISTQIDELIAAYSVNHKEIALYTSGGVKTQHYLSPNDVGIIDGPKVVRRSWPKGDIGEYASRRTYLIEIQELRKSADADDDRPDIIKYQEHIRYEGEPGAVVRWLYDQAGVEWKQTRAQAYPLRLVQSGHAIGNGVRIGPLPAVEPTRVLPELSWQDWKAPNLGSESVNQFETRWSYTMSIPTSSHLAYNPHSE